MSVGTEGPIWSSAVSATYGVFLSFGMQYLVPCYVHVRGPGNQLRCLSE
ncbi:hypothetical protein [uncultured Rikenella sp.]|nr:hypothetical protein [uncultured Rikenella sp.]